MLLGYFSRRSRFIRANRCVESASEQLQGPIFQDLIRGDNSPEPQFREFPFETQVFGRYTRVEKAPVSAIVEFYLQGVLVRKIQEIVAHLGTEHLFPTSVSRMTKEFGDQVQIFLLRPIEQTVPYLFVDASYYKIRDGARYVIMAVLVVARMSSGNGLPVVCCR